MGSALWQTGANGLPLESVTQQIDFPGAMGKMIAVALP